MPALPDLDDPRINAHLRDYERQLRELTDAALAGRLREDDFRRQMENIVTAAVLLSFLLGGGNPDSTVGRSEIAAARRQHRNSINALADDIYSGRYSRREEEGEVKQTREAGRRKLDNRLTLWAIGAVGVYNKGKLAAPPRLEPDEEGRVRPQEPRYTWRRGPTKEGCTDCKALDGFTLTASEWGAVGLSPQSPRLECQGYSCLCSWEPTDAPSDGLENVPARR